MDIPYCLGTETFRLTFGLNSADSALGQQLFVELLQFQGGQLVQLDFADIRLDVVVDVPPAGLVGGGPHLDLGVVFEPDIHPLTDCVLLCLEGVYFCVLLDCLFQLRFYLCLGLAKDVLVDSLARFRITPGGVAAFLSTVRPLPDATLAIGSALCHCIASIQRHNIPQLRSNS